MSGLLWITDKIIDFNLNKSQIYGFPSQSTFIFMVSIAISVILFCLAGVLGNILGKAYLISYTVPLYIVGIHLFWIFNPHLKSDDVLLQEYAFGTVIGFILLVATIHTLFRKAQIERNKQIATLQKTLDLDLSPVVKTLFRFITKTIQNKYVSELPTERQNQYKEEYLSEFNKIGKEIL